MIGFSLLFCVIVIVCGMDNSVLSLEKFTYNSTDISYLSNGIQFPVDEPEVRGPKREGTAANISQFRWFIGLYDHHKWWIYLEAIDTPKCKGDMAVYLKELQNGTSWATKSEY